MAALYLGGNNKYEIYACTAGYGFNGLKAWYIADKTLTEEVLRKRWYILSRLQKPIYCTAINPCVEKQMEINPHDFREGTVHIVAISKKDNTLAAAISVAVDNGETENGKKIGLPLENVYGKTGYPTGDNLDKFRFLYLRKNYGDERSIAPGEMGELYRQFCLCGDDSARIGLYLGCYHLLVTMRKRDGLTPCWLWVFDAVSVYYNLYRKASFSTAYLREQSIQQHSELISPAIRDLHKVKSQGNTGITYKGKTVSRDVPVPIPVSKNGRIEFVRKEVPFLDGVVDIQKYDETVAAFGEKLRHNHREGYLFNA